MTAKTSRVPSGKVAIPITAWLIICLLFLSQNAQADLVPVALNPDIGRIELGSSLAYLEDPEAEMDWAAASAQLQQGGFRTTDEDIPSFGYSSSAFWFHVVLKNPGPERAYRYLEVAYPLLDYLHVHLDYSDGPQKVFKSGDRLPFDSRPLDFTRFLFPLELAPGESVDVMIRLKTSSSVQFPLILWTAEALGQKDHKEQLLHGLYYGVMLTMLIFNLLVFLYIRDRNYLYYLYYLSGFILFQATFSGYAYQFLWPEWTWWQDKSLVVMIAVAMGWLLLFVRKFLGDPGFTTRTKNWYQAGMWYCFALAAIALFAPYYYMIQIITLSTIFFAVFILGSSLIMWMRGFHPAQYIFLSWAVQLFGIVVYVIQINDFLPANFYTFYSIQIGSVIQVLGFSIALLDRLKRLNNENIRLQQAVRTELEEQVKTRTRELNEALADLSRINTVLEERNHIDDLTGVKNRRFFDYYLLRAWEDAEKAGSPLSLMMIDIDHFKAVNDDFGHPAGDKVLQQAAALLQQSGRRSNDHLVRYGGEEFAVILHDTELDGAINLAEKMRSKIESADFDIGTEDMLTLTVSIGVACTLPGTQKGAEHLLKDADEALYVAKRQGRNRVVAAGVAITDQPHCETEEV